MKIITIIGLVILSVYVIAVLLIYIFQERLIFQFVKLSKNYQFNFNVPFDEYLIQTNDNEHLNALLFKTENTPPLGLIVYFHGNADNLQRWGKYAVDFTTLGYDVLMTDYRGYGKSSGTPSEETLYEDAELIWAWARSKFNYPKWILYGRSLGAAVASHLATKTNPDLLGMETPFDDLNGATATYLIPFKLKYKFANKVHLSRVNCRIFILHGSRDWIVPLSSALRLKPLLKKGDQFVIVPKGGHKNLRKFEMYHQKLKQFLSW